jgi:hypothetical protein
MFTNLRRSEVQARYALVLSVLSAVPCLSAAMLAWRNYDPVLGQIIYGSDGRFLPLFAGGSLAALGLAASAFALGWSSLVRPRNERSGSSWIGFFLGGAVATATLILLIAFYMIRLEQPT